MKKWFHNCKLACGALTDWRAELKREGELNMLLTTYVFSPLFLIITLTLATHYTIINPKGNE